LVFIPLVLPTIWPQVSVLLMYSISLQRNS
jgi:hypothetical protein